MESDALVLDDIRKSYFTFSGEVPVLKGVTFEQPDTNRFRCLALAYEALNRGGNMACIVNAANEVVVSAFLKDRIPFLRMSEVIEQSMAKVPFIQTPTYEDYVATDAEARRVAESLI